MDRRLIGRVAEDAAAQFLAAQGVDILLRNFRRRLGELDIVARQRDVLIIAEVRTRSSDIHGGAAASVGRTKQRRIARAAAVLLQQHRELASLPVRFDALIVHGACTGAPRVEWIQHAFCA